MTDAQTNHDCPTLFRVTIELGNLEEAVLTSPRIDSMSESGDREARLRGGLRRLQVAQIGHDR